MKTVGIDIGTTTIGIVVMDIEKKEVLASKTIPNGCYIDTSHEWEKIQDASLLVSRVKTVLNELLEQHQDITAIGLTGQQHGIVYLDSEGNCISPLYTWEDGRGAQPEFDGKTVVSLIKNQYGIPAATGYGLVTHLYHCKKGMVPAGSVCICTIPDYMGMCLTGRKTPLMHTSNASSLGFFDNEKMEFRTGIIADTGMDPAILPEISENMEILGYYSELPVMIALGDNQASFLGSVGIEENVWLLDAGTGGRLSVLSDKFFEAPGIEARPFLQGKYLLNGSTLCAGRAYAVLEKFFRSYAAALGVEGEQYDLMKKLVQQAESNAGGLKVKTTFNGTRIDSTEKGSITGINIDNFTPANLILGLLYGISQELHDIYRVICDGTGLKAEKLLASGNAARKNEALRNIIEEMFQAKIVLAELAEEAACGAAISPLLASSNAAKSKKSEEDV